MIIPGFDVYHTVDCDVIYDRVLSQCIQETNGWSLLLLYLVAASEVHSRFSLILYGTSMYPNLRFVKPIAWQL